MYIRLLFNLLFGYVKVEIEGYYVERFINICVIRKIFIWNLKREKGFKLYFNIGIRDFKAISPILKKTSCKMKSLKKRGVPFLINKYKKRKIFIILFFFMLFTIYISSMYVWNIEVTVKNGFETIDISQDLDKAGLKIGILKKKINSEKVINEILLNRKDIAWMGIDIKGTNIIINIVKTTEIPKIINNNDCCDIVSNKKGKITKITALNGTAIVNLGDEVNVGDILIAGYIDGKYTPRRYVHSLGEIQAKVIYEKEIEVKYNTDIYKLTGNTENKYEIYFNKISLKLYKKSSKFEYYEQERNLKKIKFFKNFYIPISVCKINNKEKNKETTTYTKEQAEEIGKEQLEKIMNEQIQEKDSIISKDFQVKEKENGVLITAKYEVMENIGEYKKIN